MLYKYKEVRYLSAVKVVNSGIGTEFTFIDVHDAHLRVVMVPLDCSRWDLGWDTTLIYHIAHVDGVIGVFGLKWAYMTTFTFVDQINITFIK